MINERMVRGALIALGVAALARGVYLVLVDLPPRTWLSVLIWLAVGSVVHDLLLAPASLGLGRLLATVLRRPVVGNAIRGLWLGLATVLLVGLPVVVGARHRANPSVIPGRPVLNLAVSLALVLTGAGLVMAFNAFRRPA
jgi:hypothetical protein